MKNLTKLSRNEMRTIAGGNTNLTQSGGQGEGTGINCTCDGKTTVEPTALACCLRCGVFCD